MKSLAHGLKPLLNMKSIRSIILCAFFVAVSSVGRQGNAGPGPEDLLTPGQNFSIDDKTVSTSFFVWYTSSGGQLAGAWEPLGGRGNWTGEVPFWKEQIKQVMSANIDVINVHLFVNASGGSFDQRSNLFQALSDLRHEGYNIPKVTPFLDPLITWGDSKSVDVATTVGKDTFVDMYKSFYKQYYEVNTDSQADSYLTRIDDRLVLDTWHTHLSLKNQGSLSRSDVKNRLQAEFGDAHPSVFGPDSGIYMITTNGDQTLSFSDEKISQFQHHDYVHETDFNGVQTVQVKPGYWDQNIRTPGFHLPRDGGTHYVSAWQEVNENDALDRVYIESWSEYDESSGIYAAEPKPPIILSQNPSSTTDDVWSNQSDPLEYIKTTAAGARQFNSTPDLDASILWHNLPDTMKPGETIVAQIIVRNDGDVSWMGVNNFKLSQNEIIDPVLFGSGRIIIDDATNEIPVYGGIFRGRPIVFNLEITAPLKPGDYVTHWQMLQEFKSRFGEELTHTISVQAPNDNHIHSAEVQHEQQTFESANKPRFF